MTDHDRFAHDDAAYVLGALSPEESAAFENHLATCMICQDSVAEISDLPAALAGITEADLDLAADVGPPDTLLPSVLRAARRERSRRRWVSAGVAGVAAAAIVALSVALVGSGGGSHPAPTQVAMKAVGTSPVEASAALQDTAWGTRIMLTCTYRESGYEAVAYNLVVHDKQGHTESAGSWQLEPGETMHFVGGTAVHRDQITSIDITKGSTPILTLTV